jgi:ATP/maltotriose-dependent transcriptional regulator MalT
MDVLPGGGRDLEPAAIAAVLADDLLALESDVTLIVDDLHAARADAPAALLDGLLRHPPPRLHPIVSSRTGFDSPSARRLRVRERALSLGEDDLRFGRDEIAAMLGM